MTTGVVALRALRATRQRRRLGEIEWFEAAYKVYVAALFGGIALLWVSDLVGDEALGAAAVADALDRGPAVVGLAAAVALAAGWRSGSHGGPLAVEAPDVVHVLSAPIDRRRALLRPAVQRARSALFAGALTGGVAGQLAGRRLPGTELAWFGSGAAFGAVVAALWVGGALVAHASRWRAGIWSVAGIALVAWQGAAVAVDGVPGPADRAGSLALWGARQHAADIAAVAVAIALLIGGVALVGRTSVEALSRRSDLVAQLRFAVTMQDLRTVVLLRRQLTHERARTRPWVRLPGARRLDPVVRRGWNGLVRTPSSRLARVATVAAATGACQVAAFRGTTPAVAGSAIGAFLVGLELLEPLSQEVDQPDHTDALPVERGHLYTRLLVAPALVLVPLAIWGALVATAVHVAAGDAEFAPTAPMALLLALPTALAGFAGAVVSVVRDAPDPIDAPQSLVPPEMAGMTTVLRALVPLLVALAGAAVAPVVGDLARDGGDATVSAVRWAIGGVLLAGGVWLWVRHRDQARAGYRRFLREGRTWTAQQRRAMRDGVAP